MRITLGVTNSRSLAMLIRAVSVWALALVCVSAAASLAASAKAEAPGWPVRGGGTLPFTDDEVLEFLRTAPIVGFEKISMGVTEPQRVVLEKDGVRLRAAFHDHDIVKDRQRMAGGSLTLYFRDTYVNQVVAYEIGRLLGMGNVPPTVLRTIDGTEGSLQLWIENARMEGDRRREKLKFPDLERARRQVADMDVFDGLINNLDRSQGNFLWDEQSWQLWLIDHTRSFGRDREVPDPERIERCSQELWSRLQGLEARAVKRAVSRYLTPREISALLARREQLLELLAARIAAQGDEAVLFDLYGPTPAEAVHEASPEASRDTGPTAN